METLLNFVRKFLHIKINKRKLLEKNINKTARSMNDFTNYKLKYFDGEICGHAVISIYCSDIIYDIEYDDDMKILGMIRYNIIHSEGDFKLESGKYLIKINNNYKINKSGDENIQHPVKIVDMSLPQLNKSKPTLKPI